MQHGIGHYLRAFGLGLAGLLVASATSARASYDYTTTVAIDPPVAVPSSPPGSSTSPVGVTIAPTSAIIAGVTESGFAATFGGTTISLLGTSRTGFSVPSISSLDLLDILARTTTVNTVNPLVGDSFTVGYTITINLTNVPPPGSAATIPLTVHGRLTVDNVNVGSGVISNMIFAPSSGSVTLGGITFTGSVNSFSPPTVNGATGSLGGSVLATVPEPGSFALLGCGLAGTLGMAYRRNRRKVAA